MTNLSDYVHVAGRRSDGYLLLAVPPGFIETLTLALLENLEEAS